MRLRRRYSEVKRPRWDRGHRRTEGAAGEEGLGGTRRIMARASLGRVPSGKALPVTLSSWHKKSYRKR